MLRESPDVEAQPLELSKGQLEARNQWFSESSFNFVTLEYLIEM